MTRDAASTPCRDRSAAETRIAPASSLSFVVRVGAVRELVVGAWSWDPSSGPAFGATSRNVSEPRTETLSRKTRNPAAAAPSAAVSVDARREKVEAALDACRAELTTSTSVVVRTTFRDPDPAKDEPDAPKTIAKTP